MANAKVLGTLLKIHISKRLTYSFSCLRPDTTGKSISSNASRAAQMSLPPLSENANLRRSSSTKQHHSEASGYFSLEDLITAEVRLIISRYHRWNLVIFQGYFNMHRDISWTAHRSFQLDRWPCARNGLQPTGTISILFTMFQVRRD